MYQGVAVAYVLTSDQTQNLGNEVSNTLDIRLGAYVYPRVAYEAHHNSTGIRGDVCDLFSNVTCLANKSINYQVSRQQSQTGLALSL